MSPSTNSTTTLRISRDLAVGGQQMVAAKHEKAVQAGNDILDAGGNAVDAAVAVGFAIGVVEPCVGGIGGVKGQENAYGPKSVAVPGMVRGMELALKTFGTKSMADVTASAARF